jgi:hypothetical protein
MLGDIVVSAGRDAVSLWRWGAARRARAQAEQDARAAEREVRAQHEKWLKMVEQQMARGRAGDASQQEAQAALSGRGGRPNELDDRWF